MRPLATIFSTAAGLLVFSAAALVLAPLASRDGGGAVSPQVTAANSGAESADTLAAKSDSAGSTPGVSVTASPAGDEAGNLERVAPRQPLSALGQAKTPQRPENFRLFRPMAPAAGRIEAGGHEIVVAGVKPIDPGQDCEAADGSTWPCGMRARTAFRLWLRGRAINCRIPDESAKTAVTARCALDGDDIGQWLVENGWASAAPDGPYADLEKQTRKAGKGIFGNGPKGQ